MWEKACKKWIVFAGLLAIGGLLAVPASARDKAVPAGRSEARSDSAPRASQPAVSSRPSAPSAPRESAPSVSRAPSAPAADRPSAAGRQITPSAPAAQPSPSVRVSPPRTIESPASAARAAAPAASAAPAAPAARPARPVSRTVETTGTAALNREAASARTPAVAGSAASIGRTERTAAAKKEITPAAVTEKIEPAAAASSRTPARSVQVKELAAATTGRTVTPDSVSVRLDTIRDAKEKTIPVVSTARMNSRTDKLITADIEPPRMTAAEKIAPPIGQSRTAHSKSERPIASSLSSDSIRSAPDSTAPAGHSRPREADRTVSLSGDAAQSRTAVSRQTLTSRPEPEAAPSRQPQPKIVINNNNTVIVENNVSSTHVRPLLPRHLAGDISYVHRDPHWYKHHDSGSRFYFSFVWSTASCGRVIYLPYTYCHSWCHYPAGTCFGLSYYYPAYHRRFIFVSIGGYWPSWYRYHRYYWYGCHPYYWYGPDIVYYPVSSGNTYNTYNYYYNTAPAQTTPASVPYYELGKPKPAEAEKPADEPQFQTAADLCFEHGVELFGAGKYEDAAAQFREAVILSPEDIILPFTYSQALFAAGDYAMAASVLRAALDKIADDQLTIYYPRGLYTDEKVLTAQIDKLQTDAAREPFNADHQLLLGYQYMGLGDLDKARGPLTAAAQSPSNEAAVAKLLELAAKLEQEDAQQ
ncbi:MAG TPA: hypothetical protein PKV53_10475 [Anaerohalosphaeraceae bacterium]|nr:hypothetical protein [Anaerohalosphaeraceae bacterium]